MGPAVLDCLVCGVEQKVNKDGSLRTHKADGEYCSGGNAPKPHFKTIEEKAEWLVSSGKVKVVEVSETSVHVTVQGSDADPYEVKWSGASWFCDCPARVIECAHVIAAKLVVTQPKVNTSVIVGDDIFENFLEE